MSWSEVLAKPLKFMVLSALLATLAACSGFRPVYGEPATGPTAYAFSYAAPGGRLDQIIYSELRLRLGPHSTDPEALRVSVSTGAGARGLVKAAVAKAHTTTEMIVSTTITVLTPEGEVLFSGLRKSSAFYTTVGQVLADTEAANEAAERGAKAVADTVRLAVLGALAMAR